MDVNSAIAFLAGFVEGKSPVAVEALNAVTAHISGQNQPKEAPKKKAPKKKKATKAKR